MVFYYYLWEYKVIVNVCGKEVLVRSILFRDLEVERERYKLDDLRLGREWVK